MVSMPIAGSISVFSSGRIDGYVLLGLTIISLILAFINNLKPLRITSRGVTFNSGDRFHLSLIYAK